MSFVLLALLSVVRLNLRENPLKKARQAAFALLYPCL